MTWFTTLPLAISLPLFVGGFVVVSCLVVVALRPVVRRLVDDAEQWDRVLGHVIGTFGVFFGILLALVAVSVYENYSDTREAALHEAGRDHRALPRHHGAPDEVAEPLRRRSKSTRVVIEEDWPDQRRGELPGASLELVDELEAEIHEYEPEGLHGCRVPAAPCHFRRLRRDTAGPHRCHRARTADALRGSRVWVGAAVNAVLIGLIIVKSRRLHLVMAGMGTFSDSDVHHGGLGPASRGLLAVNSGAFERRGGPGRADGRPSVGCARRTPRRGGQGPLRWMPGDRE